MYTKTGMNHINLHTAGQVPQVATHLAIGLDKMTVDVDNLPLLSDRYLGAFESLRVPIHHASLVEGDIIFTSSYDISKVDMFVGNVMGLICDNGAIGTRLRVRKNMFNNFANGWSGGVVQDATNTPLAWPSVDGGIIIPNGSTVNTGGEYSMIPYMGVDFISVPVFFYGAAPTGGTLTLTFYYKNAGVETTYVLSDTITTTGSLYKFSAGGPIVAGGVGVTTSLTNPIPTVWQKTLGSGTGAATFLANLTTVNRLDVTWSGAPGCSLYMGSPQLTPDYDADTASIVIAYGTLNKNVVHDGKSYWAAEYRLRGITQEP